MSKQIQKKHQNLYFRSKAVIPDRLVSILNFPETDTTNVNAYNPILFEKFSSFICWQQIQIKKTTEQVKQMYQFAISPVVKYSPI